MPKDIIKLLADWSRLANKNGNFQRVLLFGSLINRNGELFNPSASDSDIDLLFEFSSHVKLPSKRAEALRALIPKLASLEGLLAKKHLSRKGKAPIVSSSATALVENNLGIDIGADLRFTARNNFLDLLRPRTKAAPIGSGMSTEVMSKYNDEIAVLRKCQEFRKGFLAVSREGVRVFRENVKKVKPYKGPELLPKDVARNAAKLIKFEGATISPEQSRSAIRCGSTDVVDGSKYMLRLLDEMRYLDKGLRPIEQKISMRSARLYSVPSISENDLLLLWEVLAYTALEHIRIGEEGMPDEAVATPNNILLEGYPSDYGKTLGRAQKLWITGLNLSRFYPNRVKYLEEVTRHGGNINAMLLSSNSDAIKYAAQQECGPDGKVPAYLNSINDAHDRLRKLRQSYPNQVHIKTVDYPLTFGLDAVDIESENGLIYVTYYPLYSEEGDKPILALKPRQSHWYEFYKGQIEKHWEEFAALYHLGWNLRIDRATGEHIPAITALAKKVAPKNQSAVKEQNGFLRPYNAAQYKDFVQHAEHFYVLRLGKRPIGFVLAHSDEQIDRWKGEVYLHIKNTQKSPFVVVRQICIDPEFSRKGYGRGLYDFLFKYSDLDTTRYTKAIAFIWKHPTNPPSKKFHSAEGWAELEPPYRLKDGQGVVGIWTTSTEQYGTGRLKKKRPSERISGVRV